jgi:hypothetical protein
MNWTSSIPPFYVSLLTEMLICPEYEQMKPNHSNQRRKDQKETLMP